MDECADIVEFRGKHFPFSSFYYHARLTNEHLFQAAKTPYAFNSGPLHQILRSQARAHALILAAPSPTHAKRAGRALPHFDIAGWNAVRDDVMYGLLQAKFEIAELRQLLLDTGDADLIEGNNWHDTYWGVCRSSCQRAPHAPFGENRLGKLLMTLRRALRTEATAGQRFYS